MDFGKAFAYPKSDANWGTKLGILAGIILVMFVCNMTSNFLPVLGLISVPVVIVLAALQMGYAMRSARMVACSEGDTLLPDWDQWKDYLVDGLRYTVTMFVYGLPMIAAMAALGVFGGIMSQVSSSDVASAGMGLGVMIGILCCGVYLLALFILTPGIVACVLQDSGWGAGFDFGKIWGLLTNYSGDYFMSLLMYVCFSILGGLGVIACGIGVVFTQAYFCISAFYGFGVLSRHLSTSDY